MKKSTIQKTHEAIQKESPNANSMVAICETNDDITVSLRGDCNKIGMALYAAMNNSDTPELAKQIYTMIKNITYNIINNPSAMADDMIAMFFQTTDNDMNKTGYKIFPLGIKNEA